MQEGRFSKVLTYHAVDFDPAAAAAIAAAAAATAAAGPQQAAALGLAPSMWRAQSARLKRGEGTRESQAAQMVNEGGEEGPSSDGVGRPAAGTGAGAGAGSSDGEGSEQAAGQQTGEELPESIAKVVMAAAAVVGDAKAAAAAAAQRSISSSGRPVRAAARRGRQRQVQALAADAAAEAEEAGSGGAAVLAGAPLSQAGVDPLAVAAAVEKVPPLMDPATLGNTTAATLSDSAGGGQQGDDDTNEEGGAGSKAADVNSVQAEGGGDPAFNAVIRGNPWPAVVPNLGYACLNATLRAYDVYCSRDLTKVRGVYQFLG